MALEAPENELEDNANQSDDGSFGEGDEGGLSRLMGGQVHASVRRRNRMIVRHAIAPNAQECCAPPLPYSLLHRNETKRAASSDWSASGQISDGSRRRWKIGFAKVVSMTISKNVLAYVNKIIMLEN